MPLQSYVYACKSQSFVLIGRIFYLRKLQKIFCLGLGLELRLELELGLGAIKHLKKLGLGALKHLLGLGGLKHLQLIKRCFRINMNHI